MSYSLRKFGQRLRALSGPALLAELVIVFLGVYLAFLLSNFQAEKQEAADRTRVLTLIQLGVRQYGELFAGMAEYHENANATFREELASGTIPDYGETIFLAPQYPIEAIRYILTNASYDLFNIDVYVPLIEYLSRIQRLMYVEEKLVELSERYMPLPPPSDPSYAHVQREQQQYARRYLLYLDRRKILAADLANRARQLDPLLEQVATP